MNANTYSRANRIPDADRMSTGAPIPLNQEPWGFHSDYVRMLLADSGYTEASVRAVEWKVAHPGEAELDSRIFDLAERAPRRFGHLIAA